MSSAVGPDDRDAKGRGLGRDRTTGIAGAESASRGDRREMVARQKEQFGGMKFGSAFFGWLAAAGTAVLLTAIVAGVGAALGVGAGVNTASPTPGDVRSAGVIGGVALLVIVFIAYFCGGYVAGRMARFSGLKQGVAVWLWALIIAVVVSILGAVVGSRYDVMAGLNGLPRIPLSKGTMTTAGLITAIGVVLVSLIGAILGGLSGMRYHRRVDRVGLD
jgi:hypothetical protein